MRQSQPLKIAKLLKVFGLIVFGLLLTATTQADAAPSEEASKLLPERVGNFRAIGQTRPVEDRGDDSNDVSVAVRDYQSSKGELISVTVFKTLSDSSAYARLSDGFAPKISGGSQDLTVSDVGTLGYMVPNAVFFFKGSTFVSVSTRGLTDSSESLLYFARQIAERLDKGEGDIPALVKHLPDWQNVMLRSSYAVNLQTLKKNLPNQPVLEAVSFEGGAEAVSAQYGTSRLVIVEFTTPQIATENNSLITSRIGELRNQGHPAPSAYRRVGNYSVFVFDAPDEQTANQLIDQVKYQQVVQWLGENPYLYENAQREFIETTLGVFVNVVKGSGLALITCGALGGLLGGLLFMRRRSQQREMNAYSDAGGMLRLNLDEMMPQSDPARLPGPKNQPGP